MLTFTEGTGGTSDFSALGSEELGNRFANTAAGSSHYGYFAIEFAHGRPPLFFQYGAYRLA